jgi:hypothetical protein
MLISWHVMSCFVVRLRDKKSNNVVTFRRWRISYVIWLPITGVDFDDVVSFAIFGSDREFCSARRQKWPFAL